MPHSSILQHPDVVKARQEALDSLRLCSIEGGLMASGARLGHHEVWARDSMITLLGTHHCDDPLIRQATLASIHTLKAFATYSGAIPNNVSTEEQKANFRAYADTGLWWIIGSTLMEPDVEMTRQILSWYDCQDIDRSGLISMQESADWQDLFCTRGKGLYLNCLYAIALQSAAKIMPTAKERADLEARITKLRGKINRWFWYNGDNNMLHFISHSFSTQSLQEYDSLGRKRWLPEKKHLKEERYYLPYLAFRAVGEWFDTLGNLLAILSGVADEEQTQVIFDFIDRYKLAEHPAQSIYPVIEKDDPDWRDYYGALNVPHCYHNGGIWPYIGGFYVAALVKVGRKDEAENALRRLATLNLSGHFNEWHHGKTTEPKGVDHQAWSAGMFLFAYDCIAQNQVSLF